LQATGFEQLDDFWQMLIGTLAGENFIANDKQAEAAGRANFNVNGKWW
jgi:uncharacterized protein YfeS